MNRLLGGRYDLQEEIGGGGMAVVYRALDTLLGRQVAVKMLRTQYASDEEFVQRFRREAQSAARLSHANIVNLYDVGVSAEGQYYLVMEYIDGPTLKAVIRARAPLPVKEAVDIAMQVCDALQHAHNHGIIHRDIKPHNILLTQSGQVKVADFGIARANTGNTITHPQGDSVLGSVHYFSPEQARGAATDVKSDIYSLGVVLYEMLTGRLPFSGDSPVSVALKHLRDPFVEPRQINPDIPQSVENVILRCLVKDPELRYPDMAAVRRDLEEALLRPHVPKYQPPPDVADATLVLPAVGNGRHADARGEPPAVPPRRKRRWGAALAWSGVALVVLAVGAVAAYTLVMHLLQVPNVKLPDVRGKQADQAVALLRSAGFQVTEKQAVNPQPAGVVYDENPPAGSEVKEGREVTLWVSKGPQQLQMPDLSGVPVDEAVQQLVNMGLSKDNISEQPVQSSQYGSGLVVATQPAKGAAVQTTSKVVLQVSEGAMATVPNVLGMTLDQAEAALIQAHLAVGQISRVQAAAPDGTVVDMVPYKAGAQVPAGTSIGLYVAYNSGESGGVLNSLPPAGGSSPGNG
ncbi:MAG: Stk1 family PASTA domain-containing Ser/Thr kinase, partial [Alicyclobacillus sp.]|nr:Stk1 family PASTA domain-containing Ser/Thr kinase [Alicyclobacillus sp.]